jgi:hypothetical protein
MPADTDTLAWRPIGHARPDSVNAAGYFMSWHAWVLNSRPEAFFHHGIAVTDTAGVHLDPRGAWGRLGYRSFHKFKLSFRARKLGHMHGRLRHKPPIFISVSVPHYPYTSPTRNLKMRDAEN